MKAKVWVFGIPASVMISVILSINSRFLMNDLGLSMTPLILPEKIVWGLRIVVVACIVAAFFNLFQDPALLVSGVSAIFLAFSRVQSMMISASEMEACVYGVQIACGIMIYFWAILGTEIYHDIISPIVFVATGVFISIEVYAFLYEYLDRTEENDLFYIRGGKWQLVFVVIFLIVLWIVVTHFSKEIKQLAILPNVVITPLISAIIIFGIMALIPDKLIHPMYILIPILAATAMLGGVVSSANV